MMNKLYDFRHMKAPVELKERTLAAARDKRREMEQPTPRKPHDMGRRILATACALGLVLGGAAVWQREFPHGTQPAGGAAVSIAHSFGLVAYAADTGKIIRSLDDTIVFACDAGREDPENGFFSGSMLRVTGDNIASLRFDIDKGGLYRQKEYSYTESEMKALFSKDEEVRIDNSDVLMCTSLDGITYQILPCWKLDASAEEPYDPNASYGFWAPMTDNADENSDLSTAWHTHMDYFDGTTLNVTVTFTDGTTQTRTLHLKTGKLAITYPDGAEKPELTGEVLPNDAEDIPCVYGVYAEIES